MIFELAQDFHDALAAMPRDHTKHRMIELLEEAVRRDIHFIARHPTTLFQCMWNTCWWYDCPEAAKHYVEPEGKGKEENVPWLRKGSKVYGFLEAWRAWRQEHAPGSWWARSLRPPQWTLGSPLLSVFRGHEHDVTGVAFMPNGRHIVSGSRDRVVRVWDITNGQCVQRLDHGGAHVACSPDGHMIASVSDDTIRLWDAQTGQCALFLKGRARYLCNVAFSPDCRRIATASEGDDASVRAWDVRDGECLLHISHERPVESVSYSPDGRLIASGGVDGTVRLFNAKTGDFALSMRHKVGSPVYGVAFSPDESRIVSCSQDRTVRLWNPNTGEELRRLEHDGMVVMVACSPDGQSVAGISFADGTLYLWNMTSGQCLLRLHLGQATDAIAFSPDGRTVATGSRDHALRLWRLTKAPLHRLCDHRSKVTAIASSPDGKRIATGSVDLTARVWETATGRCLACLEGHDRFVWRVWFPAEPDMVTTWSYDNRVFMWDVRTGECRKKLWGHDIEPPPELAQQEVMGQLLRFRQSGDSTVVEDARSGAVLTWVPVQCHPTVVPEERVWAGATEQHLHIFRAECGDDE